MKKGIYNKTTKSADEFLWPEVDNFPIYMIDIKFFAHQALSSKLTVSEVGTRPCKLMLFSLPRRGCVGPPQNLLQFLDLL